jgi:hypothetical protein
MRPRWVLSFAFFLRTNKLFCLAFRTVATMTAIYILRKAIIR